MKKILIFLAFSSLLLALINPQNPNEDTKLFYIKGLKTMLKSVERLEEALEKNDQVNDAYFELRCAFKNIEFLLAQVDKQFYLRYYNGAPLLKLEKHVPDINIIEPKGMQVLDEQMSAEKLDKNAILKQLSLLKKHINQSLELCATVIFTDELVIHAIQYQWIRDYTLGLVGFDTPGTLRALEDAQASIQGMLSVSQSFGDGLNSFARSAEQCLVILRTSNFETLDRAEYYKNYWQPAYEKLLTIYEYENIKTWSDISSLPKEVNPRTSHLFTKEFFNTQAFIDFNEKDLNTKTIALGERLFYDKKLSGDGTLSCGSCHKPELAFADGQVKSIGANGNATLSRNAPTLMNSIYTKGFFYDLRSSQLSQQFEHVVFNKDEFNTTLITIFNKLRADSSYVVAFEDAFLNQHTKPINNYTFKTALAAYVASLRGYSSIWDKYMRGEGEVSEEAIAGYSLFMGKAACATCHFAPTFAGLVPPYYDDSETEVLGVPIDTAYSKVDGDLGRYNPSIPKELVDFYKHSFKTTTVRHINLTRPYMHNGVFSTLDEVLDFYNEGGGVGRGFNLANQTLSEEPLDLSDEEILQIIAFLKTLD